MTPINDMNATEQSVAPIAHGLPLDDPDFADHEDHDIFQALGCDLRGHEPLCDGSDVDEEGCDFQCGECERNCDLEADSTE